MVEVFTLFSCSLCQELRPAGRRLSQGLLHQLSEPPPSERRGQVRHQKGVGLDPDVARERNQGDPFVELPHRTSELLVRSLAFCCNMCFWNWLRCCDLWSEARQKTRHLLLDVEKPSLAFHPFMTAGKSSRDWEQSQQVYFNVTLNFNYTVISSG
jgi:hypothetical protein